MEEARKDKAIADHDVIDEAIRDRGDGYTVFSIVRPTLFFRHCDDRKLTSLIACRGAVSSTREQSQEF
jgi:hypothetical protein